MVSRPLSTAPAAAETIAIVKLMLKAGANPHEVWGTSTRQLDEAGIGVEPLLE
jgi:hypothetical protein